MIPHTLLHGAVLWRSGVMKQIVLFCDSQSFKSADCKLVLDAFSVIGRNSHVAIGEKFCSNFQTLGCIAGVNYLHQASDFADDSSKLKQKLREQCKVDFIPLTEEKSVLSNLLPSVISCYAYGLLRKKHALPRILPQIMRYTKGFSSVLPWKETKRTTSALFKSLVEAFLENLEINPKAEIVPYVSCANYESLQFADCVESAFTNLLIQNFFNGHDFKFEFHKHQSVLREAFKGANGFENNFDFPKVRNLYQNLDFVVYVLLKVNGVKYDCSDESLCGIVRLPHQCYLQLKGEETTVFNLEGKVIKWKGLSESRIFVFSKETHTGVILAELDTCPMNLITLSAHLQVKSGWKREVEQEFKACIQNGVAQVIKYLEQNIFGPFIEQNGDSFTFESGTLFIEPLHAHFETDFQFYCDTESEIASIEGLRIANSTFVTPKSPFEEYLRSLLSDSKLQITYSNHGFPFGIPIGIFCLRSNLDTAKEMHHFLDQENATLAQKGRLNELLFQGILNLEASKVAHTCSVYRENLNAILLECAFSNLQIFDAFAIERLKRLFRFGAASNEQLLKFICTVPLSDSQIEKLCAIIEPLPNFELEYFAVAFIEKNDEARNAAFWKCLKKNGLLERVDFYCTQLHPSVNIVEWATKLRALLANKREKK